jgi:hypothetical protein
MKKTVFISTGGISATLFIASLVVLIMPVRVYAATCTALCNTGQVTCTGQECSATDGEGCKWKSGGKEYQKKCDVAEELLLQ